MPTKIPWTDETWNPVVGCAKCSIGCLNCYAERMASRLMAMERGRLEDEFGGKYSHVVGRIGGWNGKIYCDESALDKPLHWQNPRRIFVVSMGDLFHPSVPFEFITKVFSIIERRPQHTFQILTKRIQEAALFFKTMEVPIPKNVHLGVSISTQAEDWKIAELLKIPAAVRYVSFEPMLEPIDMKYYLPCPKCDGRGWYLERFSDNHGTVCSACKGIKLPRLHWLIIGAESIGGRPGRECKLEWVKSLIDQAKVANTRVFVKQLHIDGKLVKDIEKFPVWARLQQYPNE